MASDQEIALRILSRIILGQKLDKQEIYSQAARVKGAELGRQVEAIADRLSGRPAKGKSAD